MRIAEMDWRMVEDWVRHDDRCALPLGSTEQHAGLSLATDAILAERVAVEAAEPLGIPVFPALPYGLTPYFTAFPGTVTLRVATYAAVLRDVLDSLKQAGLPPRADRQRPWRQPAGRVGRAGMDDGQSGCACALPRLVARAAHRRRGAGDRSGGEPCELDGEFPLDASGRIAPPQEGVKPMVDTDRLRTLPPFEVRTLIDDGNFGGRYQRDDSEMLEIWDVAVRETRALLQEDW